jgi:hypothetical protein
VTGRGTETRHPDEDVTGEEDDEDEELTRPE